MGDIDNPKASNAVPVAAFYADRISFFIQRYICSIVDLHHDLVLFVYVGQSLREGFCSIQPPNITTVRMLLAGGVDEGVGFSVPDFNRSKIQTNVQSEVVPGTVEVPEWVPLCVIEKVGTGVVPDEVVAQRDGE